MARCIGEANIKKQTILLLKRRGNNGEKRSASVKPVYPVQCMLSAELKFDDIKTDNPLIEKEVVMEKNCQQTLNLFTWGNPSRGDDAIGPALHQFIKQFITRFALEHIQLIEDFQLQPEHVCDISDNACVVFIDASYQGESPFQIESVSAEYELGYTTHALSPAALMAIYAQTQNKPCPPAFLFSVRGYFFELGAPLSQQAQENITLATQFLTELLSCQNPRQLLQQAIHSEIDKQNA